MHWPRFLSLVQNSIIQHNMSNTETALKVEIPENNILKWRGKLITDHIKGNSTQQIITIKKISRDILMSIYNIYIISKLNETRRHKDIKTGNRKAKLRKYVLQDKLSLTQRFIRSHIPKWYKIYIFGLWRWFNNTLFGLNKSNLSIIWTVSLLCFELWMKIFIAIHLSWGLWNFTYNNQQLNHIW